MTAVGPHPAGDDLTAQAVPLAARLAATVRDGTHTDIWRLTHRLSRDELTATIVALAAMVDPTRTPSQLLAWTVERADDPLRQYVTQVAAEAGWATDDVYAAHAAYNAGDRRPRTVEGHRVWDRARGRLRRAGKESA